MSNSLVVTVIPNWNLKEDLGECLTSLEMQTHQRHIVVVIDNGSTDGSKEFVQEAFPEVHLISLPQNLGYAAALNVGVEFALSQSAEFVFALNNDTILKPDTISHLISVLEADTTIGVATPKILFYDNPDLIFGLGDRIYPFLPLPVGLGYKWHDRPRFSGIMEFDYITGCAMMIRSQVFRRIGLFDTSYFMYYEDGDFCRRVRENGYRIVCVGNSIIYHKAALSTSKNQPFSTQIRARNRILFYRRYRHGPHPFFTYVLLVLVAVWRLIGFLLRGQGDLVKPYLLGLWEGWHEPLSTSSGAKPEGSKT
jgi:GT2 family glycosyltransferase